MAGIADKNAFKAGLFIILSVALGFAVFFAVRGVGWGRAEIWVVRFDLADDVSGIGRGAEVRVGGVKAGQVRSVGLTADMQHVDMTVSLPRELVLREGARVAIQATVTGVAWLNFEDLGRGEPLPPGTLIEGEPGTITNLVAAANELAPAMTGLLQDVRQTTVPQLNEVLGKGSQTMDRIDETADRAAGAVATLDDLLRENREHLSATIQSLREASDRAPALFADAQELVQQLTGTVDTLSQTMLGTADRLDRLLDSSQDIAGDVKEASADAAVAVREVRGIISGNRRQIELIIARARDTSSTLSLAASEIRRSPWRLMYRPDGRQRESLDLYDAARRFAEGAASLQDAAVALEDATRDPTADPERVQEMLNDLQRRFEEFDRVERLLYQRLQN